MRLFALTTGFLLAAAVALPPGPNQTPSESPAALAGAGPGWAGELET